MYDEDIVKEFLVESAENLDSLDRDFVELEEDPTNVEVLARIFRAIHTIKGTCGFFGFTKLESVTHAGENLLSKLRDQEFTITSAMTSDLLTMVDVVRGILDEIERTGAEGDADYSEITATLTAHLTSAGAETGAVPLESAAAGASDDPDDADAPMGEALVRGSKASRDDVEAALEQQRSGDPRHLGEILIEKGAVSSDDVVEVLKKKEQGSGQSVADASIRVDVKLLDKLMNMVGELVLARNQTLQFSSQVQDSSFHAAAQRLNLITTELQEGVMKTRMQPIGNVWSKFPRVVRDVSTSLGKKVRLVMEGQDTELDKTVLEAIKDPLTHIVRNSVDHGIEMPDARAAAGKSEEGVLRLRAFHESGHVVLEIADDGQGINAERVREKALKNGVISEQQAQTMSERELTNLVFLPGFSTAAAVTNISGRGVGMDVVRTNIEKIGGSIDLQSEAGKGTTIRIKIPLTLAIIPALVITCSNERYAIPQVNLLELVRLDFKELENRIEHVHGCPVYRLRGKLLPLVYLRDLLRLEQAAPADGQSNEVVNIVVVQAEDRQFGLVVDTVLDTEEIVVKPLGNQLKHLAVFAGAAIMGDGKIALILDVVGVAHTAGLTLAGDDRKLQRETKDAAQSEAQSRSLLLVRAGKSGPMAIPLSTVSRLEEFQMAQVESAGESDVIQYRQKILPLYAIAPLLDGQKARLVSDNAQDTDLKVVVYSSNGHDVGLVVDEILDITDEKVSVEGPASRSGVLSTAVIQGNVTEVLDMEALMDRVLARSGAGA